MRFVITFLFSILTLNLLACSCSPLLEFKSKDDLKSYDFIAMVKITELPPIDTTQKFMPVRTSGEFKANVLELFKGQSADIFIDPSFKSDCALDIQSGEQWLFFGNLMDGKLMISKCSYTVRYRNVYAEREWTYFTGIKQLDVLRRLYNHPISTNLTSKQFYPDGQLEIEQHFKNGLLSGKRKIYNKKGKIRLTEEFKNGLRIGYRRMYDTSGHLIFETQYKKGMKRYAVRYQDTAETAWYLSFQKQHLDHPLFGEKGENAAYFARLLDSLRNSKNWDKQIASKIKFSKDGMSYRRFTYYNTGSLESESYQDWGGKVNESCHYYKNGKLHYTVILDSINDTKIEYDYDANGKRNEFKAKCDYCSFYFDKNSPESQPENIYIQ